MDGRSRAAMESLPRFIGYGAFACPVLEFPTLDTHKTERRKKQNPTNNIWQNYTHIPTTDLNIAPRD
jgi:hypothetical protein